MRFLSLTKKILVSLLTAYLTFAPQLAFSQEQKQVKIDKKNYTVLEDKVKENDWAIIADKKILAKALKTRQVQESIEGILQQYDIKSLKLLGLYAKGQELTINNTEYIEWLLTSPVAKMLKYMMTGEFDSGDFIEELKELKQISDCAGQIADNPERHMKFLAYQHFSSSRIKWETNFATIKDVKAGKTLDYLTAETFEENGEYLDTYIKAAQQLYHDVLNAKPLEKRWAVEFINEVKGLLPKNLEELTDKGLKKIREKMNEKLEEYGPYKTFVKSVKKNKDAAAKLREERTKNLNQKVRELINKVNFDKNKIAFISDIDGDFEIYTIAENGSNVIKLTNNESGELYPQWTSDGKIIYTSKESGNYDMWIMDKDGSNKKQLTTSKSNECYGRISPDGKWLFFVSDKSGNDEIYKQNLSNRKVEQITHTKEEERFLEISPDGKWVAYERRPEKSPLEICITTTDGKLTRKIGNGHNPNWTPDGNISYSIGYKIIVKTIAGNERFTLKEEELKNIKEKTLLIYPCCWIDENRLLYRMDIDAKEKGSRMNFYIYDRRTKKIQTLVNSGLNVWNDQADFKK